MYSAVDPVAWHAAYAASANLYRGYETAAAAHDGVWHPQAGPHAHMNSFIPNNEISEPSGLSSIAGWFSIDFYILKTFCNSREYNEGHISVYSPRSTLEI